MNKYAHSTAVVTGAASGIGRALAIELASLGANVALSDIDETSLAETGKLIEPYGVKMHLQTLDVSDKNAVFQYADIVHNEFGSVNVIINNAGVALNTGNFTQTTMDEFEWLLSINFFGVVYGCKAFLPYLEQAQWGHIINVSSLFGLIGVPGQSAYNASKFAVRGLTESMRQEFEAAGSSVSCTSVHPGGVKTNIVRNARTQAKHDHTSNDASLPVGLSQSFTISTEEFNTLAKTTAQSAAQQILHAAANNKRRLLIGRDAKLIDRIQRVTPNGYHRVVAWLISRLKK